MAVCLDPVEILQRLIRTPSVNPMGRDARGSEYGEGRITGLLVDICQTQGWRWSRQPVHPGRDNLVAWIEGDPPQQHGGELLLWDVHQDTVPVDGMSIDPYAAELRDGRVYGRGACDVKGSMAAMLAALSRLAKGIPLPSRERLGVESSRTTEPSPSPSLPVRGNGPRPTIVLACTVNEECGFTGASELCRGWGDFPRPPDAAIVAEPTRLNVVVAHQGFVRWRCHAIGRAAHTSRPDHGANAIYAMAPIVQAIERYHARLSVTASAHPLCGRPSACVSTIHGGVGINTVPERATIEIDRRLAPGELPEVAYEQLVRYVAEHADIGRCRVVHDEPFMQSSGLTDDHNRPLADRLASIVREHGRSSELIGVPFGTDAAAISAGGVPTVVFGPGAIDQAHTADEFIAVDELELAAEIFYRIACEGLR